MSNHRRAGAPLLTLAVRGDHFVAGNTCGTILDLHPEDLTPLNARQQRSEDPLGAVRSLLLAGEVEVSGHGPMPIGMVGAWTPRLEFWRGDGLEPVMLPRNAGVTLGIVSASMGEYVSYG